jgi:hypothetical protein
MAISLPTELAAVPHLAEGQSSHATENKGDVYNVTRRKSQANVVN